MTAPALQRASESDGEWYVDAAPPAPVLTALEGGQDLVAAAGYAGQAPPAPRYTPGRGAQAWSWARGAVEALEARTRALSKHLLHGTQHRLEADRGDEVAAMVASLQALRADLGRIEAELARRLGRDETARSSGVLPDGRPYEVLRGQSRKAWAHEDWKHDVRRQVLSGVTPTLVDPISGEEVDVMALISAVQEVHGSGPPRVAQLKALGLDPDSYCETSPGTWSVKVTGS